MDFKQYVNKVVERTAETPTAVLMDSARELAADDNSSNDAPLEALLAAIERRITTAEFVAFCEEL